MPDGAPRSPRTPRVAVVGAGVGGLTAALELAHAGLDVRVFEAAPAPGGKMRAIPSEAGEIDGGPTVFTQRAVFEALFASVGEDFGAVLPVTRAQVLARHAWPDGSRLDLYDDPDRSEAAVADFAGGAEAARLRAFTARARRLYTAFEAPFMDAPAPTPLGVARALVPDLPRLTADMAPLSTLWSATGRAFRDPRLRQLFARYATYVGGSPFLTPAMLMLIWWSEAAGVWTVQGGMRRLARTLAELAEARGAEIRCAAPVAEILVRDGRARGVRLASGEVVETDAVLFNGDPGALGAGLLGEGPRPAAPPLDRPRRGLSSWVWTYADRPEGFPLSHHTVFFSADYPEEFRDIWRRRRAPDDPTIYVCAQDRSAADVPQPETAGAAERLLMILNAPADGDLGPPDPEEVTRCTTATFRRLAAAGLRLTPPDLSRTPQALTTPDRFAALFPGTGGSLYGANPHGMFAAFRRPGARSAIPGLYLAGGGAHPGPGVPMATRSGRHAAAAMKADLASTSASRRGATAGGISTGSPTTAAMR